LAVACCCSSAISSMSPMRYLRAVGDGNDEGRYAASG
jgi:hypothetical protein